MKKWLTSVLLAISVVCTFFPCCLVDDCSVEEIGTTKKEGKQPAEGNCSPFFACATCTALAEVARPFQITHPIAPHQVHHESLSVFNITIYAVAFWQPPRSC